MDASGSAIVAWQHVYGPGDIDLSFAPRRSPETHTEELDGEAVILDDVRNRLHQLNATATVVWSCLDGTASVARLADELADEFGTDAGTVRRETLDVVRTFGAEGLLADVDADSAAGDEVE